MAKLSGSIKQWGSNANHAVGDYPGDPVKVDGGNGVINAGFIPGDIYAPTAEETNFEFNRWTAVLQWVQDGTATAAISAHLVETDSNGDINTRRVISTTNGAGLPAVFGTAEDGVGVQGWGTTHGVRGKSVFGGSGYGGYFEAESNSGGVRGLGSGTGFGGYFTGGHTATAGVRGDGGATSGAGGIFNGTGGLPDIELSPAGNYGIDIACGDSAFGGIRILANGQEGIFIQQDDPDYASAVFYGDGAATLGIPTLEARAFGAGTGARFYASTGTGFPLVLSPKVAAPTRGAISFGGQTSRPTDTSDGQLSYNSSEGQLLVSEFGDFGQPGPGVGWRGLWHTTGGFALAYKTKVTWYGIGAAQTLVLTMTCTAGNAIKIGGRSVRMRLVMSPGITPAATAATMNFRVRDATAGVDKLTRSGVGTGINAGIYLDAQASTGWRPSHSCTFDITVPTAGDRTWEVYAWVTGGGVTLDLRDLSLEFEGVV